jgi:hypothetical protein
MIDTYPISIIVIRNCSHVILSFDIYNYKNFLLFSSSDNFLVIYIILLISYFDVYEIRGNCYIKSIMLNEYNAFNI